MKKHSIWVNEKAETYWGRTVLLLGGDDLKKGHTSTRKAEGGFKNESDNFSALLKLFVRVAGKKKGVHHPVKKQRLSH